VLFLVVFLRVNVCGEALELWQAREAASHLAFLPTFLVELDIVLHGGLLTGSITEVCYLIFWVIDMLHVFLFLPVHDSAELK